MTREMSSIVTPRFLAAAMAAVIGSCTIAFAQTNVGTFQYWNAFVSNEPDGKLCFIASQPQDSQYSQSIAGRDPVFFMVTSIPAKNIRNEASTIIGYGFPPDANVTVDIDGTTFTMFTANTDTAWALPEHEAELVEAMKAGHEMKVQGKSKRGTVTTDTYSLRGVTAALDKITAECP